MNVEEKVQQIVCEQLGVSPKEVKLWTSTQDGIEQAFSLKSWNSLCTE